MKGTLIDMQKNGKGGKRMSERESHGQEQQAETPVDKRARSSCFDSDVPLKNPDQDLLGRASLAERLADGIASSAKESSIVVGIYGQWGSGKTTVLNFLKKDLQSKHSREVAVLDFNPWLVSGEEELLVAFMTSLATAVSSQTVSKGEKAAQIGGKILDYASIILKFASVVPGFNAADTLADASDKLRDRLEKLSQSSMTDKKNEIGKDLREFPKRIVVFMDDLDRLDKDELHYIMKLVKLVADFPSVTYVLACDDNMVARSIGDMYAKSANVKEAEKAGKDYLEKIIQVPIRLPVPTGIALKSIALTAISESLDRHDKMFEKNEREVQRLVTDFDMGILPFIRTARRAKQIGRRVEWALSMMEHEINTADVVLLESLAVCQPKMYQDILDRPEVFCRKSRVTSNTAESDRIKENIKADMDSHLEIESDGEHRGGWFLLHDMFPHTEWITSNTTYGPESDSAWERDQRVASKKYLERYIYMMIPETDVSDAAVLHVIEELPRVDAAQGKALLGSILTRQNAQTLVFKLRHQAATLGEPSAVALAHAVALLSDQMPRVEGLYSLLSAAEEGPILIRELFARIGDPSRRKKVALEVLGESTSLRFAREVFRWIQYRPESSDSVPNLFDDGSSKALADVVLERIRDTAKGTKPIYVDNPGDAQGLLLFWDWFGPKKEAKHYVTKTIRADPANAMSLMHAFQPMPQSLETGLVFRGGLDADSFLPLSRIVDVSVMRAALEKAMGTKLGGDKPVYMPDDVDDRQLAEQFAYFCEHPPKQQSDATAQPPENG